MNKFILLIFLSLSCLLVNAQVGIGNTSPKAQLDISASNSSLPSDQDGLLIPRVNNFPATNPAAAQNGMLVFLSVASGPNFPGFYYWNNASLSWVGISSANKSWDITGNSVAVSGINFIGTTNPQDVDFRSNNVIKMRLSQKGQLEMLNTGKSIFLGEQAGENDDLTNNDNVFIGFQSGFNNVGGFSNVGIGYQSLFSNTTGFNNYAMGYFSLLGNSTGNNNTAIGTNTLMTNTVGVNNIAIGTNALSLNTTGNTNTAVGAISLIANTTGDSNTAVGFSALHDNTTGYNNVGIGGSALLKNITGFFDTAVGTTALLNNTTGSSNTAIGASSLYNNNSGSSNSAVGTSSLLNNLTGNNNTAFGHFAMRFNTIGGGNTGIGKGTLQANIDGANNAAFGFSAMSENLNGNFNTASGFYALFNNLSGICNVASGANALLINTSGNYNTAVGNQANVSLPTLNNATAIGNLSTVNSANKIRLGNAAVTIVEGQVSFSNPSDARFKNDVNANVPGLDFIMKLKPVTYHFDTKKFDLHLMQNLPDSIKRHNMKSQDYTQSTAIVHSGFLAQDIEKAANQIGYDFDGLHVPDPNNPTDNYSVAYSQFIMPIVKSVQEQQALIETQNSEIERLKRENARLESEAKSQITLLNSIETRLSALEKK